MASCLSAPCRRCRMVREPDGRSRRECDCADCATVSERLAARRASEAPLARAVSRYAAAGREAAARLAAEPGAPSTGARPRPRGGKPLTGAARIELSHLEHEIRTAQTRARFASKRWDEGDLDEAALIDAGEQLRKVTARLDAFLREWDV